MSKKKTSQKNLTSEGILDLFKKLWSGERAADDSDPEGDAPPAPVPGPVNAQTVNIQLPYTGTGEEALNDPEVKKLVALFQADMQINHNSTLQGINALIKNNPTDAINFMLRQSGVKVADKEPEGKKSQRLMSDTPLSMTKKQKATKPGEGQPAELPLNSYMQKKLGLPPKAVNIIVKNIAQTLKARGFEVAESKINTIVKEILLERLMYTKKDFDVQRKKLADAESALAAGDNTGMQRKELERMKRDAEEKIKKMEAELTTQKADIKGRKKAARDVAQKAYSTRKGAIEKQAAKHGAIGKIIYKYAARQADKDPEFMKVFGKGPESDPNFASLDDEAKKKALKQVTLQRGKIVTNIQRILRRQLRRRGYTDEEIKKALRESMMLQEQLAITNLSETDIAELVNEINKFYPYAKKYLGFDRPVELTLISDPDNAKDTFGKTAYYSPKNEQMTIFVDGRHPKDIIRSFSHELVHHAQNCRGEFDRDFSVGENYIETDDHLKEMEREAYDKGNMCLRTYESYLKKENKTMKEKTLRKAIREAIKRVVENKTEAVKETTTEEITETTEETVVTEDSGEDEAWHQWKNEHADDDHIKEIEHHLKALRDDRDYEEHGAEHDHDKYEDEGMDENLNEEDAAEELDDDAEELDEDADRENAGKVDYMKEEESVVDYVNEEEPAGKSLHESLAINKGQLVFDKLVKKWCK